jgi:hypothetical protein
MTIHALWRLGARDLCRPAYRAPVVSSHEVMNVWYKCYKYLIPEVCIFIYDVRRNLSEQWWYCKELVRGLLSCYCPVAL